MCMAITGIGSTALLTMRSNHGHAQPARRPSASARHRPQVRHLRRPGSRPRADRRFAFATQFDLGLPVDRHPGRGAARSDADRAVAVLQRLADEQGHDPAIAVPAGGRHPDAGPEEHGRYTEFAAGLAQHLRRRPLPVFRPRRRSDSVESADHILNGDGLKAGLKQIIDERKQADLGAGGLGRLTVGAAGTSVSLDADASPFGFKLVGATTAIAGATVNPPVGSPPTMSVDLPTVPNDGDTVNSPSPCRMEPPAT